MPITDPVEPTTSRLTAAQIFADAVEVGEEELKRSSAGLSFSGFAAPASQRAPAAGAGAGGVGVLRGGNREAWEFRPRGVDVA